MNLTRQKGQRTLQAVASRSAAVLFVFSFAFVIGIISSSVLEAEDLNYRFSTRSASVSDCTANYGYYISSALTDYTNNTDLTLSLASNVCSTISYTEGDYGVTPWKARAIARNSPSRPCADFSTGLTTGLCNTTTYKATSATIYINSNGGGFPTSQRHFAMRHEMGHVFGLGHSACSADSVMKTLECTGLPSSLRTYDKNWINDRY